MGLFDKFKGNTAPDIDGLPNMETEHLKHTDVAKQAKAREKEFLAREAVNENEGLPSVNRRKGGNKLVTIIGFIFIICAAAVMIISVNGDKSTKPKKKKEKQDQIANNLPPIAIPSAPPPIVITPSVPASASTINTQVPAINKAGSADSRAIPLHTGSASSAMASNGKPIPDWTDRKLNGSLLTSQKSLAESQAINLMRTPSLAEQDGGQNAGFGNGGGRSANNTELSTRLEPTITKAVSASMLPDRNFLITKGTTLDCALETAVDSSVPGITTCRLTRDVYSDNGHVLLLDRGSQLTGEYKGGLKQGQVRLFVLWTRAKTPNGVVTSLNSPGTDALGRSGLEGWVDNHFLERFGAAIMMSFIKDAVTIVANKTSGSSSTTNIYGNTTGAGEKVVEKILDSTVNIPPTITKNQGEHIQVMVARDLDFSGVYGLRVKK